MAHYVICSVCKRKFDRDKTSAVLVSPRRYAHETCIAQLSKEEKQIEKDRQELEEYIVKLFNLDYLNGRIGLQLKKFMQEHPEYTFSGIKRTLQYFYEIKNNPVEKSNGGIGIVPWVYEEARQYFYNQWLLSQKNSDKDIAAYVPKVREVIIQPPKREPKKRHIFTFLDKEED